MNLPSCYGSMRRVPTRALRVICNRARDDAVQAAAQGDPRDARMTADTAYWQSLNALLAQRGITEDQPGD